MLIGVDSLLRTSGSAGRHYQEKIIPSLPPGPKTPEFVRNRHSADGMQGRREKLAEGELDDFRLKELIPDFHVYLCIDAGKCCPDIADSDGLAERRALRP